MSTVTTLDAERGCTHRSLDWAVNALPHLLAGTVALAASVGFTWPATAATPPLASTTAHARPIAGTPQTGARWENDGFVRNSFFMETPAFQSFKRMMPTMDEAAVSSICHLTLRHFSDVKGLQWDLRAKHVRDAQIPLLFLRVNTQGLDIDELIERELRLREDIAANARLSSAGDYMVISLF